MVIREQKKLDDSENILPLINVVFLLLIFFILSGVFTKPELLMVNPPESNNNKESDVALIEILINDQGELAIGEGILKIEELDERLKYLASNKSNNVVQLKADHNVEMRYVFEIMNILKNSEHEKFNIITLKK